MGRTRWFGAMAVAAVLCVEAVVAHGQSFNRVEVTSLVLTPPGPAAGQDVTVTMTVTNTGKTDLKQVPWVIRHATERRILGEGERPALAPGGSFRVTAAFQASEGLQVIQGAAGAASATLRRGVTGPGIVETRLEVRAAAAQLLRKSPPIRDARRATPVLPRSRAITGPTFVGAPVQRSRDVTGPVFVGTTLTRSRDITGPVFVGSTLVRTRDIAGPVFVGSALTRTRDIAGPTFVGAPVQRSRDITGPVFVGSTLVRTRDVAGPTFVGAPLQRSRDVPGPVFVGSQTPQ